MKGTEKIIAHIQALAQAEQQCALIRKDYEEKADEAYTAKIRAGVKACEDLSESKKRIAEMESKKNLLALKQEMVSAAFDRAKEIILQKLIMNHILTPDLSIDDTKEDIFREFERKTSALTDDDAGTLEKVRCRIREYETLIRQFAGADWHDRFTAVERMDRLAV